VITLPLREMLPVPVWKVPDEAEKSKFAAPPADVKLLAEASVTAPFSEIAPVPVLKVVAPVWVMFVITLPLREMMPVPVWKVPDEPEKWRFAPPPPEVKLLAEASVTAPFSEIAP